MEESSRTITRGWLITLIGIAVLAGSLFGLCLPVYLNSYDSSGIRVKCGNGYYADLLQATVDDERSTSGTAQPATGYTRQCMDALAHRREWLIPVAALGTIILISELVAAALRHNVVTRSAPLLARRLIPLGADNRS